MFLGGNARERLKPVSIMGCPPLNSPFFHGVGYHIRDGRIQVRTVLHGLLQFFKHTFGQVLSHDRLVEHISAEDLGYIHNLTHNLSFLPA